MQFYKSVFVMGVGLFLAACSTPTAEPVPAAQPKPTQAVLYRLVAESAQIRVTVVKDAAVAVTGAFSQPSGLLSMQDGRWSGFVGASTASFATGDPVRDGNIQKAFFRNDVTRGTGDASKVAVHWENVDFAAPAAEGVSAPVSFDAFVDVGGVALPIRVQADVTRLGTDLRIRSRRVELSLRALGFEAALAALIQLCGHKSIADVLTVEFQGDFRPSTLAPIRASSPHP